MNFIQKCLFLECTKGVDWFLATRHLFLLVMGFFQATKTKKNTEYGYLAKKDKDMVVSLCFIGYEKFKDVWGITSTLFSMKTGSNSLKVDGFFSFLEILEIVYI